MTGLEMEVGRNHTVPGPVTEFGLQPQSNRKQAKALKQAKMAGADSSFGKSPSPTMY